MTGYPNRQLGEICEVAIGRQRSPRNATGAHMVPYLRAANVKDGRLLLGSMLEMNFTPEEQHVYGLIPGDVLVTEGCGSPAELGASAAWTRNLPGVICFQNTLLRLRSIPGVSDPRYLLQLARWCHHTGRWLEASSGASILHIGHGRARRVVVPCPPVTVQRQIGAVLSAYDDLIENNTRRIQILEEMAQAIYREWFVEFRFPGHEGVRMVDSDLGAIPEGWQVGTLADLFTLQRGFDLPRQKRVSGPVPVVAATGVHGTHSTAAVRAPGVVTGRSGSLGAVLYLCDDFWPLNTTLWAKEFRAATPELAFFVLKEMRPEQFNSGAAVPTLNRNDIARQPTLIPATPLVRKFSSIARDIFGLTEALAKSIQVLRQTRDLLLPRLISGDIDVSNLDVGAAEPAA